MPSQVGACKLSGGRGAGCRRSRAGVAEWGRVGGTSGAAPHARGARRRSGPCPSTIHFPPLCPPSTSRQLAHPRSFSAGFWARMGGVRLVGTRWADNAEALQLATTGQHVAPPGASYLEDTL